MYLSNDNFDTSVFYDTDTKLNSLVYGSLTKNNTSSYSDFIDRNYYKEHNNPILFNDSNIINDLEIFNGDASISSFNFISTVYYDVVVANRPKKTSLWDYIVGAILIVAAVVVEVVTLGSGTALAALAISYGVSLIVSGLKLNALESMTNTDYNLGLRNCI